MEARGESGSVRKGLNQKPSYPSNAAHPVSDDNNRNAIYEEVHRFEKTAHFNRERIHERIVHAKGTGAHSYMEVTHDVTDLCKAAIATIVTRQDMTVELWTEHPQGNGVSRMTTSSRGFWPQISAEDKEMTAKNIAGHIQGAKEMIMQRQLGVSRRCDESLAKQVEEKLAMKRKSQDPYTIVA